MYVFRLAAKNVISRKSSVVIILFIAFAIALLAISNAVFDGTDNGIETTFVNSFTGNIVIRPQSDYPLSLFGDETPVTGELSAIPPLIPYTDVLELVQNTEGITKVVPQISGMSAFNIQNQRIASALFGVNADSYLDSMEGIELLEGKAYSADEDGIMLNKNMVESIQEKTGAELHIGDTIQIISSDGTTFTIRAAPLSGIYNYKVPNTTLDQIALVSPPILRDLMGMQEALSDIQEIDSEEVDLIEFDLDFDELFTDSDDSEAEEVDSEILLEAFKKQNTDEVSEAESRKESTVWSFLVCKTENAKSAEAIIARLNAQFRKNDWQVQAVNWRNAAGGSVSLIFYLRTIFNVGIILILATGFIVVNNTLIISALGRVCETGTLRALGANRLFVALQFFFETAILTVSAGILGCILGAIVSKTLSHTGIRLQNMYLAQLFGGEVLTAVFNAKNAARCMALSVLLAFIGWLYPVHVALSSNPVTAMRGQI